nr:hypothetical protein [Lactiplantibacillus plantarum]
MIKRITLLCLSLVLLLSACGTKDIKNGKVPTKSYPIVETNVDNEDVFTLIPITTSTGKTTSTAWIPMYQNISQLKVKYRDEGRIKQLKSNDFEFVKTAGKSYLKIARKDINKNEATCVVYRKD